MPRFERILVQVDHGAYGALFRLLVGYTAAASWSRLFDGLISNWYLIPFFFAVLLALRLIPAVLRKVIPFSHSTKVLWAERRQLAKRFDSYQWQKLFWMGIGMGVYTAQAGGRPRALVVLAVGCLACGAIGLAIWRYRAARLPG